MTCRFQSVLRLQDMWNRFDVLCRTRLIIRLYLPTESVQSIGYYRGHCSVSWIQAIRVWISRIHSDDRQPVRAAVHPGPPTLCMDTYPPFDPSPNKLKNDMIGNGTQIFSCILYFLSVHNWGSRPPPKRCKQKRHFVAHPPASGTHTLT